jgi:hypothetical protein
MSSRRRLSGCEGWPIVIQIVVRGSLPRLPILKARCVCDPEALVDIARRLEKSGGHLCEEADRFSLILHDLRMGGAWKRTNRGRLRRTEEMLCAHIDPELRAGMTFLDLGASDGITTLEALHTLRRAFGDDVTALLGDLNLALSRYRRGPVVEYRAGDGEPVMARFGPIGVRLSRSRRSPRDGSPLARLYMQLERFRRSMREEAPISLVHPLVRREPGIAAIELDCLVREDSLRGRLAAVRASNVLNLGYFERPQLYQAVGNLHSYLRDGGCFVVSRNHDERGGETENGSVWVKEGGRFRRCADFGDGSEIGPLVDDWRTN